MNQPPSTLREELHPLLTARIRVGALLVGVSIVLYGLLELWQQRAPLGLFFAVKVVQVVTVVAVWLAVGRARHWRRSVGLALFLVVEICVTLALSGILAGEVASAPLLFVLMVLGSATLLPWGVGPQSMTVGVAAAALILNAWLVPVPEGFGYTATAACLAFIASICVAYELDQHRRRQHRAEQEERDSAGALREEIFVAEASTHAARELLAARSTSEVLTTLCRLETRLLACDASYTFTRDSNDAKAFVAVAADGDSGSEWISRRALRIPDIGLARMLDRLDRDEPVVVGEAQGVMLPVEGRMGVCTALFAGRDVIGIQVAVRRQARPFSSTDIELARRLAHTASAAIAQARLLETPDAAHPQGSLVGSRVWRELQTPLSSILRLAERAGDSSLPVAERRALVVRIASTARDTLHLLERLEHGGTVRENDGTARR
jgi:GAF domain-containing protein